MPEEAAVHETHSFFLSLCLFRTHNFQECLKESLFIPVISLINHISTCASTTALAAVTRASRNSCSETTGFPAVELTSISIAQRITPDFTIHEEAGWKVPHDVPEIGNGRAQHQLFSI